MVERKFAGAVWLLAFSMAALVSACGGGGGGSSAPASGTPTYTVGGTVSGLSGTGLVVQNNGITLPILGNGAFTFSTALLNGAPYNVTVSSQPTGQTCTVTGGTGTINAANVTNVSVACSATAYAVGGSVSGLAATGLTLQTNGMSLSVNANGPFTFPIALANGAPYNVAVSSQPIGQTCTVTGGAGTINGTNVTSVSVACVATTTYTVGGTVSGLAAGAGLVLANNGSTLPISANGAFTFPTGVANGATYNVTVSNQPVGQACTMTGGTGTINGANVTNVSVVCSASTATYTVGGTVSGLAGTGLTLQNNGSLLAITANGPFTFPVALANGAPYRVTIARPDYGPTQTCTVSGGAGTISGANVTNLAVSCVTLVPRYAFTANSTDNSISSYVIDAATGNLRYIGKAAAGTSPVSVTLDPAGKYAYVANSGSGSISQYTVGVDGTLTPMVPATVAAGTGPRSVTLDPTGRYAYVANNNGGSVSQYTIGANGILTPMVPATVPAGVNPAAVAVDRSGSYAYVANYGSNDISAYTIGTTGALTQISCGVPFTAGCSGSVAPTTFKAGTGPYSVVIDLTGRYVYVGNLGGTDISQYTIAAGGGLAALGPVGTVIGSANSLIVDPSGRYVYVQTLNGIAQLAIGASGVLTFTGNSTSFPVGQTASSMIIDPEGKYAYMTNNFSGTNMLQYTVGSTGLLSPMAPITAVAQPGVTAVAIASGSPVQAVPQYAYVANQTSNDVSQYTIGAGGGLTPMAAPTVTLAAGSSPRAIAVDPTGKYAYVATVLAVGATTGGNNVAQFTIGGNGALTPMVPATVAAGTGPQAVAIDPSGRYAYVLNGTSTDISAYTIGPAGTLTQANCGAAGTAGCTLNGVNYVIGATANSLTVDPTGRYLFVTVSGGMGAGLWAYTIGAGGHLTYVTWNGGAVGLNPTSVAVDPSGQYAYVANAGSLFLSANQIVAGGAVGQMQAPNGQVTTIANQTSVIVDPAGQHVYWQGGGYLGMFTIGGAGWLSSPSYLAAGGGTGSNALAIDPSAKYIYMANAASNNVTQYTLGAGGALPVLPSATVAGGTTPIAIVTSGTWQ